MKTPRWDYRQSAGGDSRERHAKLAIYGKSDVMCQPPTVDAHSAQYWQRCSLAKMLLTELPFDILSLLPDHVASLDDLHALILTSRTLYESASNPPASTLHRLVSDIHPDPNLLIAVKARALADWSIQSPEARDALFTAISSSTGLTALLDLALEVSPLTLADLSFLARMLKTVLMPVADILRTALSSDCSPHYPNFQLLRMLTHYWIYCDLFYHTISYPVLAFTTNCKPVEPLSEITRREWIGKALSDNFSAYIKVNAVEDADAIYSIILSFFCNNLMDRVGGIAFHNSVFHKASYDYCAAHQGITTLKIFLHRTQERRAGPAAEVKELSALGESIGKLSQAQLQQLWRPYGMPHSSVGWRSLVSDLSHVVHLRRAHR